MNVNKLTEELVGTNGSRRVEILLTLEIEKPDGTTDHLFLKAFADGAAASTTRNAFYISCDTIYASGCIAVDPRNFRVREPEEVQCSEA